MAILPALSALSKCEWCGAETIQREQTVKTNAELSFLLHLLRNVCFCERFAFISQKCFDFSFVFSVSGFFFPRRSLRKRGSSSETGRNLLQAVWFVCLSGCHFFISWEKFAQKKSIKSSSVNRVRCMYMCRRIRMFLKAFAQISFRFVGVLPTDSFKSSSYLISTR